MRSELKDWQRSIVRNSVMDYRHALQNYYIKDKRVIEMEDGYRAFSLLSPPVGSQVARRRLRFIIDGLKNTPGADKENHTQIPTKSRTPHFVTIAVTYDCQCNCLHCSASSYKAEVAAKNSLLSTFEIKKIVRNAVSLGTSCIVFTGGEPLLKKDIYELIEAVDNSKAICTIFTNGEYLDENVVIELKEAGLFGVFVSLDFSDAQRHEENRRRSGIFLKALRGIKRCQKHGLLTGISTYVTKEKIQSGELNRLMDLARELNVLEVFIFDAIAVGRLSGGSNCLLEEEDFEWIRNFRKRYNEKKEYPRIIHQTMLTSIAFPCSGEGCPAGVAHMHIRANGDVSPCDFTPVSFGNVRQKPLKEIWQEMASSEVYAKASPRCRLS